MRRAGFGGQEPAATPGYSKKPSCRAETLEKMVAKTRTLGTQQPLETDSIEEGSEPWEPPRG